MSKQTTDKLKKLDRLYDKIENILDNDKHMDIIYEIVDLEVELEAESNQ